MSNYVGGPHLRCAGGLGPLPRWDVLSNGKSVLHVVRGGDYTAGGEEAAVLSNFHEGEVTP